MRVLPLSLLGLLLATSASADCEYWFGAVVETKIDRISAPVRDPEGWLQTGCLLSAEGKVLGYATEDSLCRMTPGTTVKVRLFASGCCDTGPGLGADFTCGLRSGSGSETVYGNGVTIQSITA